MTPLVIIGAGGFGRECHDIVVAMNQTQPQWDFLGFIDDGEPDLHLLGRRGTKWIGDSGALSRCSGAAFVAGVGSPGVRRRVVARAETAGLIPATLIHPSSTFGLDVMVGPGSVICSHASVTTNVGIGRYVHLDQNVTVGHDAVIGDYARINPGASISGAVNVGEGTLVGTNAAIIQGVQVAEDCVIGAGAVVIKDVPPRSTIAGVPARPLE